MRILLILISFTISLPLVNAQAKSAKKIRLPNELKEASGLYIAGLDSLWWHNDSGDKPQLVLTDRNGKLKKQLFVAAQNRDWEDLTADKNGNLYIGDFGNNQNKRKDLCIYIYNPERQKIDSIVFKYPDQTAFPPPPAQCNFDLEGFFWHLDTLHLFSKNRLLSGNYYTKHYTLPAQAGNYTATFQDSIFLKNRVITAAAISKNGKTVALLSYFYKKILGIFPKTRTTIWTIQDFNDNHILQGKLKSQKVWKFPFIPTQYECIDFIDDNTVYIASEKTILFKQKAKRIKLSKVYSRAV